jgi:hypothetical protein
VAGDMLFVPPSGIEQMASRAGDLTAQDYSRMQQVAQHAPLYFDTEEKKIVARMPRDSKTEYLLAFENGGVRTFYFRKPLASDETRYKKM